MCGQRMEYLRIEKGCLGIPGLLCDKRGSISGTSDVRRKSLEHEYRWSWVAGHSKGTRLGLKDHRKERILLQSPAAEEQLPAS